MLWGHYFIFIKTGFYSRVLKIYQGQKTLKILATVILNILLAETFIFIKKKSSNWKWPKDLKNLTFIYLGMSLKKRSLFRNKTFEILFFRDSLNENKLKLSVWPSETLLIRIEPVQADPFITGDSQTCSSMSKRGLINISLNTFPLQLHRTPVNRPVMQTPVRHGRQEAVLKGCWFQAGLRGERSWVSSLQREVCPSSHRCLSLCGVMIAWRRVCRVRPAWLWHSKYSKSGCLNAFDFN